MLYTTATKARESGACISSYERMAKHLGGVERYGKDTPVPLDEVLKVCGLQDTIWCFRCTSEPSANTLIEFTCQCAEHTLHFFEDKYPDDKRPRQAIEAARICITDKNVTARDATRAAWDAAEDAAWAAWAAAGDAEAAAEDAAWAAEAAAGAAAGDAARAAGDATRAAWAARDAARAAAGDATRAAARAAGTAETAWQSQTLIELLRRY